MSGTFHDIYLSKASGKLKLGDGGFAWKNKHTSKVESIQSDSIESVQWTRVANGYQLRTELRTGMALGFEGFRDEDFEALSTFFAENYNKTIEKVEMAVNGMHWGEATVDGDAMRFVSLDGKPIFSIPGSSIAKVTSNIKMSRDVTAIMKNDDQDEEALVEFKFQFQGPTAFNEDDDDEELEAVEPAAEFTSDLSQIVHSTRSEAEPICQFADILRLRVPRGKFSMDLFPENFRLRSQSHEFMIKYENVSRMFLLPDPKDKVDYFIIQLDKPAGQGKTRYPFLVMEFSHAEDIQVSLNLTPELKKELDGKLEEEQSGPISEVVVDILKNLSHKKVIRTGEYISSRDTSSLRCAVKSDQGHLFMLDKCLVFLYKPVLYIALKEIHSVEFQRLGEQYGIISFDVEINYGAGLSTVFSGLMKDEAPQLDAFFRKKNIEVSGYNKGRNAKTVDAVFADEDEGSSDDEEYQPSEESDVPEEMDSDYKTSGESDGSGSEEEEAPKKTKKAATKRKAASASKAKPKKAKLDKSDNAAALEAELSD